MKSSIFWRQGEVKLHSLKIIYVQLSSVNSCILRSFRLTLISLHSVNSRGLESQVTSWRNDLTDSWYPILLPSIPVPWLSFLDPWYRLPRKWVRFQFANDHEIFLNNADHDKLQPRFKWLFFSVLSLSWFKITADQIMLSWTEWCCWNKINKDKN